MQRSISYSDAQQLCLPIPGLFPLNPSREQPSRSERVFVNRDLVMRDIEWIGFDMDYTLALYRQEEMDALSVKLTIEHLLRRGYPEYCRDLKFDASFPVRGLLIDKKHGNVLKMDRFRSVCQGYHGFSPLSEAQLTELYHDRRVRPGTPRYHWIDTLFSLSEVVSYCSIIEAMESRGETIDYSRLFSDVRDAIDEAHREGDVYRAVTSDLERYLITDPHLAETLHKLRSAGKKLFLLTNSPASYTETVMTHLLQEDGGEYPSWKNFFDVICVGAQKPRWFQDGRPFLHRDGDILRDFGPSSSFERGKIYEGGNRKDFERHTGARGSKVLYVGDHIYGDILRSKKESTWRTAMMLQELGTELFAQEDLKTEIATLRALEETRQGFETELREEQSLFKALPKGDNTAAIDKARHKKRIERLRSELRDLNHELQELDRRIVQGFHPYWGSLFKVHGELSLFGVQVENYADIYMRRVSDMRHYSPQQHYRSPHDLMPHEL